MSAGKRGGVVLRVDGALHFVPASTAVRVAPPPRVTPVPGAPPELLGIALHDGTIVPVLVVGPARAAMVVCQCAGELVGVVGGDVVATGSFDAVSGEPGTVEYEGRPAATLDIGSIYARVQSGGRPADFGRSGG